MWPITTPELSPRKTPETLAESASFGQTHTTNSLYKKYTQRLKLQQQRSQLGNLIETK